MQINLLHLKSRSKFAAGCKLAPGCKFLKHRSHGQKYNQGANCAYKPSFRADSKIATLTSRYKLYKHERSEKKVQRQQQFRVHEVLYAVNIWTFQNSCSANYSKQLSSSLHFSWLLRKFLDRIVIIFAFSSAI